jgi:hypothetical protein
MAPTALGRRGERQGFAGRPGGRTSGRPWPPRTRRLEARLRRADRKPKQARRDAPARKPAHPWPRQPWAVAANAKGSPDGRAVAPPGDRGRRARGGTRRGLRPLRATARRDGGPSKAGGGRQRNREARCRGAAGSRLRRTAGRSHLRATVAAAFDRQKRGSPAAWKPEAQAEGIRVATAKAIRISSAHASGFKGTGGPRIKSSSQPTTTTTGRSHLRATAAP